MHKNGSKIFQLAVLSPLRCVEPQQSTDKGHTMHFHSEQSAFTEHTNSKQQASSVDVRHSLISVFPYFPVFTDWPLY